MIIVSHSAPIGTTYDPQTAFTPNAIPGNDYPAMIVATSGLIGYWRLNETSGTTATDSSSGGHNGTYNGGFTLAQSGPVVPGGNSVLLNGSTGYIDIPGFSTGTTLSVEAWVYLTTASQSSVFVTRDPINSNWALLYEFALKYRGATGGSNLVASALNDSNWYHLVATQTGLIQNLYVNGSLVASSLTGTAVGNVAGNIQIGRYINAYFYGGRIAHVALYSVVLPISTIYQHVQFTPKIINYRDFGSFNLRMSQNVQEVVLPPAAATYISY